MAMTKKWRMLVSGLIDAARDIREDLTPRKVPALGASHARLFRDYVTDLRAAREVAEEWWQAVRATQAQRARTPSEATAHLAREYPAGPVGHGAVVGVLRKYWLACATLNESLRPAEQLPAEEMLLGLLCAPPNEDLAAFLSALPYWPIGMDETGKWA